MSRYGLIEYVDSDDWVYLRLSADVQGAIGADKDLDLDTERRHDAGAVRNFCRHHQVEIFQIYDHGSVRRFSFDIHDASQQILFKMWMGI